MVYKPADPQQSLDKMKHFVERAEFARAIDRGRAGGL
jgi:hypothetical protein